MPKTVLMLPFGDALAHTVRLLEVAEVLREHGHRVVFASDGRYLALVREAGFPVKALIEVDVEWLLRQTRRGLLPISAGMVDRFVREELALFEEIKPDIIVRDLAHATRISAEVAGLPLVSLLNAYQTRYALDPVFTLQEPRELPPDAVGPILQRDTVKPYNEVRQRFDLPPLADSLDLLTSDLNLLCDVPEYAPTAHLPKPFVYVGPITWEGGGEVPAWLGHLDPDRPTVYVTIGSSGHRDLFQVAVEAFSGSAYQVLMTTGRPEEPLPSLPDNFFATPFAPGSRLLARSDVVVCHGGNGTAYQALAQGVPIIAFPLLWDQRWNARRQAELGVGLTLQEPTPDGLRKAVDEILGDGRYKAAAERFRQILARYHGPQAAARLIESYG
ncbi:MAG: glycosyltransferase [Candidatus Methylomirabilales bacterium]